VSANSRADDKVIRRAATAGSACDVSMLNWQTSLLGFSAPTPLPLTRRASAYVPSDRTISVLFGGTP
jgi:hypothetical protein